MQQGRVTSHWNSILSLLRLWQGLLAVDQGLSPAPAQAQPSSLPIAINAGNSNGASSSAAAASTAAAVQEAESKMQPEFERPASCSLATGDGGAAVVLSYGNASRGSQANPICILD
jgi:hypothetical protein